MEYDITAKVLIEKSHREILQHFLGLPVVESTLLEPLPQQTATLRSSDFPLLATDARGQRSLVVLEVQSAWEWEVPFRLLEYRCRHILHERLTDALSCVLLLRPSRVASDLLEDAEVRYRYRLVRVYELDAAPVVQTPIVNLLAFVPVMRGGVELTDTAERLVYESPLPSSEKADMLTGMAFLAGLVSKELTQHLILRRRDLMIQSAAYEIIKEIEGREGEARGEVRGEVKGLAEATLETLAIRFNPTIAAYRQLEQHLLKLTEPERLRALLRVALRASDVAEFERALAG
jgi:predicted transposase YdaD